MLLSLASDPSSSIASAGDAVAGGGLFRRARLSSTSRTFRRGRMYTARLWRNSLLFA